MTNKAAFFRCVSHSLRKGILREIYTDEELAVLRVADSFYIATDYTPAKGGFVAFLVNGKMIRAMMLDHGFLRQMMETSDQLTLAQLMFVLNDKTFRGFGNGKKSTFSDLNHRFVDPAMEEWIFKTYGLPISPETQQKKRLLR